MCDLPSRPIDKPCKYKIFIFLEIVKIEKEYRIKHKKNIVNIYHEHEQQQHQQKQQGFCDRCKGPTFVVSWGPLSVEFNGPLCVAVPMPRSLHPAGSSDTLQDILKIMYLYLKQD